MSTDTLYRHYDAMGLLLYISLEADGYQGAARVERGEGQLVSAIATECPMYNDPVLPADIANIVDLAEIREMISRLRDTLQG